MFRSDERAVAMQVGAALLFGFLIVSLAFYQAFVVPQESRKVEFDAYQEASDQLVQLHNDVVDAGTTGSRSGTTVKTGVDYPVRTWTINPGAPASVIRTTDTENVTLSNASSVNDPDVMEYWDGSTKEFRTKRLSFEPGYNELKATPLALDGTLAYRQTEGEIQPLTSQAFLIGDRITLVTVSGDVSDGGQATTLTTEPVSVSEKPVPITSTEDPDGDGDPELYITLPSEAPATQWQDRLLASNPNVVGVTDVAGGVRVELDGSVTYRLRLAQVEVRERGDGGDTVSPTGHYVVRAAGHNTSITANQTADLTAEVRDRYNNPVSGTEVTFTDPSGGTTNVTTNEFGQATFSWTPTETGEDSINASFDGGDIAREKTTFTVEVGAACPDNDAECGGGRATEKALEAQDQFLDNGQSTDIFLDSAVDDSNTIRLNFNSTSTYNWTAFEVRLITYYTGNSNNQITGDYDGTTIEFSGLFTALNSNYTVDTGTTYEATLNNLDDNPSKGDWVLFSVKYEREDGKLTVSTYIQQVQ